MMDIVAHAWPLTPIVVGILVATVIAVRQAR
jgi:hypothetical protein